MTGPDLSAADAHDLMLAALACVSAGDEETAQTLFHRALALEPDNPAVLTGVAIWHHRAGRLRDAVLACDAAIGIAPDYPDAWLERGAVLAAGGSSQAARDSYARAAQLAPEKAAAHAGVAALAARDGASDLAREAAQRALALDPANLVATSALASIALEAGDPAQVIALLELRLSSAALGLDRSQALTLVAAAYERLGDAETAYAHYARAKADFAALQPAVQSGPLSQTQFVEAIAAGLAAVPRAQWAGHAAGAAPAPNHLFLIGYPRSGTTLAENVLASLPGVAALEERPTLTATDTRFLLGDRAGIVAGVAAFAALDDAQLAALRQDYWDHVAAAGVSPPPPHFVDMDPLKGTRLPFIARLFPAARILIMRRDPRDVVWSCFKTSFAQTSSTLEYTTLERAARHYDAMMRLTDLALERLPLAALEIDYRRLTRDFDAATRDICDFSGIAWTPDVRRFDRTAKARGVGTASAAQVRKGLYDGSGQWRPFARWLEPVMPILAPWVERFGYDD